MEINGVLCVDGGLCCALCVVLWFVRCVVVGYALQRCVMCPVLCDVVLCDRNVYTGVVGRGALVWAVVCWIVGTGTNH